MPPPSPLAGRPTRIMACPPLPPGRQAHTYLIFVGLNGVCKEVGPDIADTIVAQLEPLDGVQAAGLQGLGQRHGAVVPDAVPAKVQHLWPHGGVRVRRPYGFGGLQAGSPLGNALDPF